MKTMGNVEYAPSASSEAFFFPRSCLRSGMYIRQMLSLFDCIKIKPK